MATADTSASPGEEDEVIPISAAQRIAAYSPEYAANGDVQVGQVEHRIGLVNAWQTIRPGSRVLELGCGQGYCTTVLAEAVGPGGHVDAVDPAPADYGAPVTLAQAQAHISAAAAVGPRIAWHRATPQAFLATAAGRGETWDCAVLAHCVWYFRDPRVLGQVLEALKGRAGSVCVAEYALKASHPAALPHVLTALARGALECHKSASDENIQTPLSPNAIRAAAEAAGWSVVREAELVPEPGLRDGIWETGTVVRDSFVGEIEQNVRCERAKAVLLSARDATAAAMDAVGGIRKVRTMDVWCAVLRDEGAS